MCQMTTQTACAHAHCPAGSEWGTSAVRLTSLAVIVAVAVLPRRRAELGLIRIFVMFPAQ